MTSDPLDSESALGFFSRSSLLGHRRLLLFWRAQLGFTLVQRESETLIWLSFSGPQIGVD